MYFCIDCGEKNLIRKIGYWLAWLFFLKKKADHQGNETTTMANGEIWDFLFLSQGTQTLIPLIITLLLINKIVNVEHTPHTHIHQHTWYTVYPNGILQRVCVRVYDNIKGFIYSNENEKKKKWGPNEHTRLTLEKSFIQRKKIIMVTVNLIVWSGWSLPGENGWNATKFKTKDQNKRRNKNILK